MNQNQKSGQEFVWDYPRAPRIERSQKKLRVEFNGRTIAETRRSLRVLETSHPLVYYFPPGDVHESYLERTDIQTSCEYKGVAS
jgi:uncharacterized protein (DUF427 family)